MNGGASKCVQTGARMNKRLLKVMRALADLQDTSLGELFEQLVLAALAGTPALSGEYLTRARELCGIYGWPPLDQSVPAALATKEGQP